MTEITTLPVFKIQKNIFIKYMIFVGFSECEQQRMMLLEFVPTTSGPQ